jgi:hypothetical protein
MRRVYVRALCTAPGPASVYTEVQPPNILLLRGDAVLDEVQGIPDEYLQMSGTYEMAPEQRVEWEVGVRSLYDSMVRIVREANRGEADRLHRHAADARGGTDAPT